MQNTLLAMIYIRTLTVIATRYSLLVNRLWLVKRLLNWPPYCGALKSNN